MTEIRQIQPDEWELLKRVRLAALDDSPEAFSVSASQARQMPTSNWQQRAQSGAAGKDSFCTLAIHESTPVGIAVGLPDKEDPIRAYLVSMWVSPGHRGSDVASRLLAEVKTWAAGQGARFLLAGVTPSNNRARAFYERMGFVKYKGAASHHAATTGCDVILHCDLIKQSVSGCAKMPAHGFEKY